MRGGGPRTLGASSAVLRLKDRSSLWSEIKVLRTEFSGMNFEVEMFSRKFLRRELKYLTHKYKGSSREKLI